jgi:Calcineurin-like phosphoesterase
MIKQLLDRDFVLRHLNAFGTYLDQETKLNASGDPDALDRANKAGVTVEDLGQAKAALIQAQSDPQASELRPGQRVFLPPHPTVSALQSAIQNHLLEKQPGMIGSPGDLQPGDAPITDLSLTTESDGDTLFEQFGPADIGWISVGFAALVKLFRGARPFTPNPAPQCTIGNSVRLILLADWGTGVPRARKLGASARQYLEQAATAGTEVHVIHLGDVYYSGWAAEYDAHFLPFWPVQPNEADRYGSWCLNGNHDMYSGGHGYFDHLLADRRFARQGQSSYFSLENDYWQILALDTAYKEFDLEGNQANWVAESRNAQPAKKGVLLSHHQPYSSYETAPDTILKRLQPVLERDLILGWFWGHEHRCAFYEPMNHISYGRCVGHGGVPVLAPSAPMPDGVRYEFGDWVVGTDPHFARFGFVVIDCVNERMHIQYIMEDAMPHNTEDFVADSSVAAGQG